MRIKIFFDDGQKVAWREGVVTREDDFSVTLDDKESISKQRIIRIEVIEDGRKKQMAKI